MFDRYQILPVNLTSADHDAIRAIAEKRQKSKAKVRDQKIDANQSALELNILGAIGEFAFGTLIGQKPHVHRGRKGDGGIDFLYNGWSIDVKYIPTGGVLVFRSLPHFRSDVAVAVSGPRGDLTPVTVRVLGCIGRERFRTLHRPHHFQYGDFVALDTEKMSPCWKMDEIAGPRL